jgi:cysteine desulfurase/selenocysteine lyase
VPYKFEAGTPNVADAVGLGAAIDYLSVLGMEDIRRHERDLTAYALEQLAGINEVIIYGPKDAERRGGVISFNLSDVHPHDVGTILDSEGIAIRAGHHCCNPAMRKLGISGTARASFYLYTTRAEVDSLVGALAQVRSVFARA